MMDWKIEPSSHFERDLKKLDKLIIKKSVEALEYLVTKEDPRSCGRHKYGNLHCIFSFDLGRKFRLLYDIDIENSKIKLFKIGPHTIYNI